MPSAGWAADALDPFEHPDESEIFQAEERLFAAPDAATAPRGVRVAVLTDRQIRERGYRTLAQALGSIPGLYVAEGADGRSVLMARGLAGDQRVLLTVDGAPWAEAFDGRAWLDESLPLSAVRRIEVTEGPGALGLGDRGVAATVSIQTYRPEDLQGGFLRWEVGSFERVGLSAVYGERRTVRGRDVGLRSYARATRSDGDGSALTRDGAIDLTSDSPRAALGGGLVLEYGDTRLRYDHVDWRYSPPSDAADDPMDVLLQDTPLQPGLSAELLAMDAEFDAGRRLRLEPHLHLQRYQRRAYDAWWSEPSLGEDALGDPTYEQEIGVEAIEIVSDRYGAGVDATIQVGLAQVTRLGVGVEAERLVRFTDLELVGYTPLAADGQQSAPEASALRPFATLQHHWSAAWWAEFDAAIGVSRRQVVCTSDDQDCGELPGPALLYSARADALLLPTSTTSVRLSAASEQRAPTLEENLLRIGEEDAGNLDLGPETLERADLTLSYDAGRWLSARAGGLAGRLRDEIGREPDGDASARVGTQIAGARAEASFRGEVLEAHLAYAWTRALDQEQRAPTWGFPSQSASARLVWSVLEGVRVAVLADGVGPREQSAWFADLNDAPAYALVHAGVTTDLLADGRARLDVGVRNLLDTPYPSLGVRDDLTLGGEAPLPWEGEGRRAVFGLEFSF